MSQPPNFEKTSRLIARALGLKPAQLHASFRPATLAELPHILSIRHDLLGTELRWDDTAYLTWRYRFGHASLGRGECWVLVRDEQVLGMVGTEELSVNYHGRSIPTISVMDIAMHPHFEGIGLGPWMAMSLCHQFACVVAVGSNPKSRGIVSKIFTRQADRRCYAHLISTRTLLARRIAAPRLGQALSRVLDTGLKLWRALCLFKPPTSLKIQAITQFEPSHQEFLDQSCDPHHPTLARTTAALNWRLFEISRTPHSVWGAFEHGELVGLIATHHGQSNAAGKFLTIEDCAIVASATLEASTIRLALLTHAIQHAVQTQCERVSIIASHNPTEASLRRLGFIKHPNDFETFSVSTTDPALTRAIEAKVPWHLQGIHTDRDVV
jgi:hypothetical protein